MASVHKPSAELFIVQALRDVPDFVAKQIKLLSSVVEEVAADVPSWVVHVASVGPDPRKGWTALRHQLAELVEPGLVFAEPVLVDEKGERHLPTGEVTVRFEAPPTDPELSAFAEAHDLRLRARTLYAPRQAVFLPRDPSETYLPELVSQLLGQKGVTSVWANTRSAYRRTSPSSR